MNPEEHAAWLEERKKSLGGSDVAAIMGLNPYRTPMDVYLDKKGLVPPIEPTPVMLRGIHLEGIAADLYTEKTGRKMRRQPLRRHPEHPWLHCSIDRQILASDDNTTAMLEIKCPGLQVFSKQKAQGIADQYTIQIIHNCGVWGYGWGAYAAFSAERWELIEFDLDFDQVIWEQIVSITGDWWEKHIVGNTPPEEKEPEKMDLPAVEGNMELRDDEAWNRAILDLRESYALAETAKEVKESAIAHAKELMGEATAVEGGGARCYHTTIKGRISFDKKKLIAEHPEIHLEAYEKRGASYQTFRPFFYTESEE